MTRPRLLSALLTAVFVAVVGAASVTLELSTAQRQCTTSSLAADISPSTAQSLARLRQSRRALSLRPDKPKEPPMTRTARSVAIAALTAVAAIVAADFTPPASAQSDDETTGRIVARLLDDGRVEFGWQPTGGARALPTKRYFPATIDHNRWLRSSPVEVGGTEIGRINARQSEDGRIEFAFTPTDGERIAPQARYFPADARVGRWLRSTEIAIGSAADATGYIAVSAGQSHTCAIRTSGEIACWGQNDRGQTDAPDGSYTTVSVGGGHTCATRSSTSAITCWGNDNYYVITDDAGEVVDVVFELSDAPDGKFRAVSAGTAGHTCAIHASNSVIECWGTDQFGETVPPDGKFSAVSAGGAHTCGLRETGTIECWGNDDIFGVTTPPAGRFTAVGAGSAHTCAIRTSGEIACWGQNFQDQRDAPDGKFTAVSAGYWHTCGLRESGAIECWGGNRYGQRDAPEGSFTAVGAGGSHTCAIRESDRAIECWGYNEYGQATPPTD